MPPPSIVPSEEVSNAYIASLQPSCSSSSSGITCTHADELDSDDPDADDIASSDKDMDASDSMTSMWTDSKHSSYLNFMEQNFVRDLYEREYCSLDVCGQPSQPHAHVDETYDPDSAESRSAAPFGPMEFKVWENGNWTWRVDLKPKVHPWTLLLNPWVQHFRTRASCRSDMSNTTFPKIGQDEPQTLGSDTNGNGTQGSRGKEVSSSIDREGHYIEPGVKCGIQIQGDSTSSRKRTAQVDIEQATSMRRRAQFGLDEGSMTIGVFGELCKRRSEGKDHCAPQCGDG